MRRAHLAGVLRMVVEPGKTLILPFGRDRLLRHIPAGTYAAEIGVFRGRFSRKILARARPCALALVDAWTLDVDGGHIPKKTRFTPESFARLAVTVPRHLRLRFPFSKIEAIRSLSVPAADRFANGALDWIYIDGDHSHKGALADLRAWAPKVREDGLILGHDFTDQNPSFGVIEAVRDFTAETDWNLIAVTTDYFPTFMLARQPGGLADTVLARIFRTQKFLSQVDSGALFSVRHRRYGRPGGKTGMLANMSIAG